MAGCEHGPEAHGPEGCTLCDCLAPGEGRGSDSLDTAVADAEAALPDRLRAQIGLRYNPGLSATAWAEDVTTLETLAQVEAPTPTAAFRALAAELRERTR